MPRVDKKAVSKVSIRMDIWGGVVDIRRAARTPQAKAAAKLARAAEKAKVKAKIERDKQPKDKTPKDKVQPIRGRG